MHTHLHTHIYIHNIYIHTNIHSFKCTSILNIPIPKKHLRDSIWTEKYVDLNLYDQVQFALLEKTISSSDSSLSFNLLRIKGEKIRLFSQIHVGNCSKSLTYEKKWEK